MPFLHEGSQVSLGDLISQDVAEWARLEDSLADNELYRPLDATSRNGIMNMKAQYDEGRRKALQKCLEAVWDVSGQNGQGPYSEGQFDACEEVANVIMKLQAESETPP